MKITYDNLIKLINESDSILIGAGSGLSTAAGVKMDGSHFTSNFKPWIEKYHFTDLYTSSFYKFKTPEEKWAYFSKYIRYIDIDMESKKLYQIIYDLIKDKNYFIITTNVDDQFYKYKYDPNKIFRVQGSYRLLQCSIPCHNKLYDADDITKKLVSNIDSNLCVPSNLIPKCPICGKEMEVNLRKDDKFVQDDLWYKQNDAYDKFLRDNKDKKVLLLEFGVGFNTPGIIRIPFEEMVSNNLNWKLIRFNKVYKNFYDMGNRFMYVDEDIDKFFN